MSFRSAGQLCGGLRGCMLSAHELQGIFERAYGVTSLAFELL